MDPLGRPYNHNLVTFSFYYAFSENFVLPISHDEVVYGKCSMLDKMGGPREYRFNSMRTFLGYMMAHPGKKLMFMGQEFAQYKEWNFQTQLDWEVLEFDPHYKYHQYVKAINKFYKEHPELWECDTSWEGFHWISAEDNKNSVIAFRRIAKNKDEIIVVCNFQPVRHEIYEIGVPYFADYEEVFSSDAKEFGGSGITNGTVTAKEQPMHDEQYRITLDIPPMSAIFFKPKNIRDPHAEKPEEAEAPAKEAPVTEAPKEEKPKEEAPAVEISEAPEVSAPKPETALKAPVQNGNQNRNGKRKGKRKR